MEITELLCNNFFFALKYLRTKWRALCGSWQKEAGREGGGGTREPTALILEMRADCCLLSVAGSGSGNVFQIISKYRFNLASCLLAIFQTELTTALI